MLPPTAPPTRGTKRAHRPGPSGARSPGHQTPRKRTTSPGEANLSTLPWKNGICGERGELHGPLTTLENVITFPPRKRGTVASVAGGAVAPSARAHPGRRRGLQRPLPPRGREKLIRRQFGGPGRGGRGALDSLLQPPRLSDQEEGSWPGRSRRGGGPERLATPETLAADAWGGSPRELGPGAPAEPRPDLSPLAPGAPAASRAPQKSPAKRQAGAPRRGGRAPAPPTPGGLHPSRSPRLFLGSRKSKMAGGQAPKVRAKIGRRQSPGRKSQNPK